MSDPNLNSVHLEFPRREDFRRARNLLLDARGQRTCYLEIQAEELEEVGSHTFVEDPRNKIPTSAEFWLLEKESVYPLKMGVNTIGRLPDNDVVLEGPYVSRRHCAILVHAGNGCEVYDIASKNGTFINGAKLAGPTHLATGDELRMCDRHLVFMSKKCDKAGHVHDVTQSQ